MATRRADVGDDDVHMLYFQIKLVEMFQSFSFTLAIADTQEA